MLPLDRDMEILSCLSEEAGEVIQRVSKVFRFGFESCHPVTGEANRQSLNNEVGDLLAIVDMALARGLLDEDAVAFYRKRKAGNFLKYSRTEA